MALRIKKGDTVVIRKGKDKGKSGKVLTILLAKQRAVIEGVNLAKKHMRKGSEQQPSGIVEIPMPVHVSNLSLWCGHCKKGVRFGVKVSEDKSKTRVCKGCQNPLQ